jgi:hypothetical protein
MLILIRPYKYNLLTVIVFLTLTFDLKVWGSVIIILMKVKSFVKISVIL